MSIVIPADMESEGKCQFVPRIRCTRKEAFTLTPSQFAVRAQREGEQPNFTVQEYFKGRTMVRPYYDYDWKMKDVPSEDRQESLFTEHLGTFRNLVEKLHPGRRIEYAQRHGRLVGGDHAYKISYRAYVQDEKVQFSDIPHHVRKTLSLGPKETHPYLDLSVYKEKEQLLGVVYGCKDIDTEKRYLRPLDPTTSMSDFLVQNVTGITQEVVISKSVKASQLVADPGEISEVRRNKGSLYVSVVGKKCVFREQPHQSNHPFILMYSDHVTFHCHDPECKQASAEGFNVSYPSVAEWPSVLTELRESAENRQLQVDDIDYDADYEDKELGKLLQDSVDSGSTTLLARVAFRKMKGRVICLHRKEWYQFQRHIWQALAGIPGLLILSCLEEEFLKIVTRYENHLVLTDTIKKKHRSAQRILNSMIREPAWRKRCGEELSEMFEVHAREQNLLLDNRPFLKAFRNGVYDLETDTFRPGKPDDYLTKQLPYDLPLEDDPVKVEFLNRRLCEIQPNPDQRFYLLFALATGLEQLNREEVIYIWKGIGRNGKGLLKDLMVLVLGQMIYCCTPQASLLTSNRPNSHQASSDLADISNMCSIFVSEPEENQLIKTNILRQITGNDTMLVRRNYGNEETFNPTGATNLLCNDIPNCDADVSAVWDRYRIIVFGSYFCDHPNPNNPWEFKIDRSLKEKLPTYAPQFMRMLIGVYREYRLAGHTMPPQTPQMLCELRQAKHGTNPVRGFAEEFLESTNNADNVIPLKTLRDLYEESTDDSTMRVETFSKRLVKLGWKRGEGKRRFPGEQHPLHFICKVRLRQEANEGPQEA
ncbi:hypothetical protein HDV00_004514 [Rhizophlyctis rosea]|nr:hypothetical protein HDV00_004514 [Rhizophlyctis rosea]